VLICSEVTELTTDYLDRALPPSRRLAMGVHLALCSFCRKHLRQVRQTIRLLRDMPHSAPTRATEDALVAMATSKTS
jgi:anti-sigma factor RsiW